jgi:hypothetical protein
MVKRNVKVPMTGISGPVQTQYMIYQSNTSSHHRKRNNSYMLPLSDRAVTRTLPMAMPKGTKARNTEKK